MKNESCTAIYKILKKKKKKNRNSSEITMQQDLNSVN